MNPAYRVRRRRRGHASLIINERSAGVCRAQECGRSPTIRDCEPEAATNPAHREILGRVFHRVLHTLSFPLTSKSLSVGCEVSDETRERPRIFSGTYFVTLCLSYHCFEDSVTFVYLGLFSRDKKCGCEM